MKMYNLVDEKFIEEKGIKYNIFNDLQCESPYTGQRPYFRRNTKITIFKWIKSTYPEIYSDLVQLSWFEVYRDEVEDKPKIKVDGVEDYLKVDTSFANVINKLSDTISDMGVKVDAMNTNTKLEQALIDGIVDKGKELAVADIKETLMENLDNFIKETYGAIPNKISLVTKEVEYEKTGIYHKDFEKILKLVNMNLPVMLTGGAGAGKNYMLEQVADALNMSFYYTSTITQEYKLTGFIDGGGKFHETEFYKAFTSGGIFMLDEIDASIPEALVILNGAIANGYFDFPIGRELAHDDFRVVCAGNTVGLGADLVYTGRNVLDGATLDRFVLVEIDYDNRIEAMLCQDYELREFLYAFRKSVTINRINHIIGMRAFKYSYEMFINGFDKEFIIKSVITKGLMQDDINVIIKEISNYNSWTEILKGMNK